jgi:signal peptidase
MKKYIYGALVGLILTVLLLKGGISNGAPFLSYVYSNSMEPLIQVGDAFFVWPYSQPRVGDIIMYRPAVLKATYITHRIVGEGEQGFITKGDNSYYRDQDSGEPEVTQERISGKVITINGQPILLPGIGKFTDYIQSGLGGAAIYLSALFLLLGVIMLFAGKASPWGNAYTEGSLSQRRRSRRRLRLRHIYKGIPIAVAWIIMLTIYLGSRVSQIDYLVSEYPGTLGDQVEVHRTGQLTMTLRNNGLIPVWSVMKGVQPLSIREPSKYIGARSSDTILIEVLPQHRTGVYRGYIQIYNYPAILPREWILYLHNRQPLLAVLAVGIVLYLIAALCLVLLQKSSGLEGWRPLKAARNKGMRRRIQHRLRMIQGRGRSR